MTNLEDNERLTRVEESTKQAHKRIDNLEKDIAENRELTTAVKELAVEVKYMREDMSQIDERVKIMEEKPAKRYENIVNQIIGIIVAGVVGYFIAKLGL